MKYINRSSVIGFILGAIVSPLVLVGGLYLYVQHEMADFGKTGFSPPDIPGNEIVSLDWNIQRLDETTINLEQAFKGKVLFLNFWATWCPPCTGEMPSIEKLYKAFGQRVQFVCVSHEKTKTIKDFRGKNSYTFPMFHNEGNVPEVFHADGIPATFIISNEGRILLKHVGGADWAHESVVKFLEEVLETSAEVGAREADKLT